MSSNHNTSNQSSSLLCESPLINGNGSIELSMEAVYSNASDKDNTNGSTANEYNLRNWITVPVELRKDLDRGLHPDEMQLAIKDMQLLSPLTLVPEDTQPTAVILIGAGGAGKTTLLNRIPLLLPGFDTDHFFLHDGDHLRRYHGGFQRSCNNVGVGYIGGWQTVKPHIRAAKAVLLQRAVGERRNVLIPTGQHAPMYVEKVRAAGYKTHIIGVFADCDTIMTRGVRRGHETGREYLGTVGMWEKASRDMLQLVRDAEPDLPTSGLAMLLDNREFNRPAELTVAQMHDVLVKSGVPLVEE